MAARFPQSGSAISGYQIKASLVAAGVKAVVWAASANSVHVLLAGQTTTTVLTRTAGSATFNSTDGLITGDAKGSGTSQYFALSVSGGIDLVANDYTQIVSYWGDGIGDWATAAWLTGSDAPLGIFQDWDGIKAQHGGGFLFAAKGRDMGAIGGSTLNSADGTKGWMVAGLRSLQSDATARNRVWAQGAEVTTRRDNGEVADTTALGSTSGRPIYFGGTIAETGSGATTTELSFEAVLYGTGSIPDAAMDALTATTGPADWLEMATVTPVLSSPTAGTPGATSITIGATSDSPSDGNVLFLRRVGGSAASAATIASTGESQAATANPQSRTMTGFTAGSPNNYVDMVQVGAGGNSNVVTAGPFTMADAAATAVTMTGPSGGVNGAASTNFTVGANGAITGTITVTPSAGAGGGTFTPSSVNISSGSPTATFTYTPASTGAKSISVTNNGGLSNPSPITYTVTAAPATTLNLTGIAGAENVTGLVGVVLSAAAPGAGVAVLKTITGAAFDASGNMAIDITGLGVLQGQYRWVELTQSNGDPAQSPAPFGAHGPVIAS